MAVPSVGSEEHAPPHPVTEEASLAIRICRHLTCTLMNCFHPTFMTTFVWVEGSAGTKTCSTLQFVSVRDRKLRQGLSCNAELAG